MDISSKEYFGTLFFCFCNDSVPEDNISIKKYGLTGFVGSI